MEPFDLEKAKNGDEICTRDGKEARLLEVVKNDTYPVIAVYLDDDGNEYVDSYTLEGRCSLCGESEGDLMMSTSNAGYINIFKNGLCGGIVWPTRAKAEANIGRNKEFIATVRVEWDE